MNRKQSTNHHNYPNHEDEEIKLATHTIKTNFDSLNEDLVAVILTYLSPSEIVRAIPTCHTIHDAAQSQLVTRLFTQLHDKRYTPNPDNSVLSQYVQPQLVRAAVIDRLNKEEEKVIHYRRLQRYYPNVRDCLYKSCLILLTLIIFISLGINTEKSHYIALGASAFVILVCCLACYKNCSSEKRVSRSQQILTAQRESLLNKSALDVKKYGAITDETARQDTQGATIVNIGL